MLLIQATYFLFPSAANTTSGSTTSLIHHNHVLLPYNLSTASPSLSITSPATMERLWIANDSSAATLAMWQPPQAANMRGGSPPGNLAGSFARSWYVRIHAKWVAIAPVMTSPYKGNNMCLGQAACFCTSLNVFAPEKQQAAQLPNAWTIAVLMHGNALVSKAQSRQQGEGGRQGLEGVDRWTDETEI